jgi:hypothetical protein
MENKIGKYLTEKRKQSKREIDGEEYGWGLTSDGWNDKELSDVGLMSWINDIERLAYELKNCRRDSYADFGDTIQDLSNYISDLVNDGKSIARDLKSHARGRR